MADIIPEDFNPLAAGGVAQRNSSDPLTPIGLHAGGLTDVLPETTIDSIYNPGAESPTTLAVDPLEKAQERVLSVEQSMDPLKLFAGDDSGLIPGDPEIGAVGSASNHAPEMTAYFRAPVPKVDPGMLAGEAAKAGAAPPAPVPLDSPAAADTPPPDVWADPAPAMMAAHPADGTETDAPLPPPPAADVSGADHAAQENEPGLDSTQADDVAPPDPGQPATEWPSAVTAPPTEPPSVHAGQSGAQDAEALKAAFKRGAGLDEWSAAAVTPELMETVGQLLQTAAQGAVSLLAARAAIKQEIHLSVTLINPKLNNPLKFLPDGHTALLQMLGPKMPGFMAPLAAMQEAFDDLLRHQAAIAAGTQAMIEALFHRFDPDSIESRHPKNGMGEKLSQTVHHARLWNLYTSQYRLIKEEIKDDFFKRLGAEFHDAYNREYGSHAGDDE
jgi:FHA domain-containing protein